MRAVWLCVVLFFAGSLATDIATYHSYADAALQSFLMKFWEQGNDYIANSYPQTGSNTGYWTFAHGFDAVLDGVERTGYQSYYGWIAGMYNAQIRSTLTSSYYDDENWMGLAFLRAYDLAKANGDSAYSKYMTSCVTLINSIARAWDTTCCGTNKGGIWWDSAHTQKATASNAGPVIFAARMYQRTSNSTYLTWAQQWYTYWKNNMVSSSYQIADHIGTDGTLTWWGFTYNNGLMVGAATALYKATSTSSYLTDAHNYANYMLAHEVISTTYGNVLYDGTSTGCAGDCIQFKGPSYRYLVDLYKTDTANSASIHTLMQASADALWNIGRDSTRNLFAVDWSEALLSTATATDMQQNVACQVLSQWAEANGAFPGTGAPKGRLEAEEAYIVKIGLEASYAGFSGWGYLAGWGATGESVTFFVTASTTTLTVSLRYASVQTAVRTWAIDGTTITTALSFPSTGAYTTYGTLNVASITTTKGGHTLTLSYASGSSGYMNLDSLTYS